MKTLKHFSPPSTGWRVIVFLLFVFITSCIPEKDKENSQKSEDKPPEPITLIFAGDAMHHMPQLYASYVAETNSFDYTPVFQHIKPFVQSADLAFCNFETILAGKPYTGYPQFSAPDEFLFALKDCGFDVIQIANNHILDRGSKGLERTIQVIEEQELHSVGTYLNQDHRDSSYPQLHRIKGVNLAILNYTYGTNGLATKLPNLVNIMDSTQIINDIKTAREQKADLVIALMHWGSEYQLKSDKTQQKWADLLISNGIDLIIGSHPHVVQEVDFKVSNEKFIPVFYSLGNLISNQREKHRDGGIMAKIEINPKTKIISSVSYMPFYVYKGYLNNLRQYYIIPTQKYIDNAFDFSIPKNDSLKLIEFHHIINNKLKNVKSEL